eukprot:scaffold9184_cov72-Skeletonema_dohrnii-CCMP3373.AAC.3
MTAELGDHHRQRRWYLRELYGEQEAEKRSKVVLPETNNTLAEKLKYLIEEKRQSLRANAGIALDAVGDVFSEMRDSEGSALQQEIISMIGDARAEEDIREICSKMLGLGFTSLSSSIDDVVRCCFVFRTAADFVNMAFDTNSRIVKFAIERAPFYDKYIHPVIEKAWDLVLEKYVEPKHRSYVGEIGKLVGMRLF